MRKLLASTVLMTSVAVASPALADLITADEIASGFGSGFSFSATGGDLTTKTVNGQEAAGVSGGPSGGEIDDTLNEGEEIFGERLSGDIGINRITLAFLFDGPEFDDFQERAQILGENEAGDVETLLVENLFEDPAVGDNTDPDLSSGDPQIVVTRDGTDVTSSVLTGFTAATEDGTALVELSNPFTFEVSELTFTAPQGTCGTGPGTCDNQSDYGIASMDVPVPGTIGLLGAGLIGLGFGLRRKAG